MAYLEYKEAWAVEIRRIDEFFRSQADVRCLGEGRFLCGQCRVTLTALPPRPLGPVMIPYTQVELSGESDSVESLYHRFFLRFISAGG